MNPSIEKVVVDGSVIQKIIYDKLMPACQGELSSHAILALLSLSVLMMKPDVDVDTLSATVMGMSEAAILHLVTPTGGAN